MSGGALLASFFNLPGVYGSRGLHVNYFLISSLHASQFYHSALHLLIVHFASVNNSQAPPCVATWVPAVLQHVLGLVRGHAAHVLTAATDKNAVTARAVTFLGSRCVAVLDQEDCALLSAWQLARPCVVHDPHEAGC